MSNADICRSYLDHEEYRRMPRQTLAKLIYSRYPECFATVDSVRSTIRQIVGAMGNAHRIRTTHHDEKREQNYGVEWRASMPKSHAIDWEPFTVNKDIRNLLVISDIHLPYHDEKALELAIGYGVKHNADAVLINGDLMDFHRLSRYVKDPRSRELSEELQTAREFFTMLRQAFPTQHIYFKLGNHEERYEHYLILKAPELLGVTKFTLSELLDLDDYGVKVIDDKRIVMAGKLPIIHGHEAFGGASVNPARTLYLRAKSSSLAGHNHRTSEHTEKDIHGEMSTTWSTGCLSELNSRYMPVNNWNHGFAFIEIDADGLFEVRNKRILNGRVL